jgi:hypothetical protein
MIASMNPEKTEFLKYRFVAEIKRIPSDTPPLWGKMTLQQMIEHFSDNVRIASGKTTFREIITPSENLQRVRDFLMSEKPFRENTVNPMLPEDPLPVRNPQIEEAIAELQTELQFFFNVFEKNKLQITRNPIFGDLNFEENVQLLHKHALHHLRQFNHPQSA